MKLKELRISKGWSQTDIAKETGIKQPVISAIEAGRENQYSPRVMKKIADTLGVAVMDIDEFAAKINGEQIPGRLLFKGKLDKILPPVGVFPRLLMQDGVTYNGETIQQRVVFLINPGEAAQLQNLPAGTDLEVEAPGLGSPDMGIKSYRVKVVSYGED